MPELLRGLMTDWRYINTFTFTFIRQLVVAKIIIFIELFISLIFYIYKCSTAMEVETTEARGTPRKTWWLFGGMMLKRT